jgi:hypothetical protein
MIMELNKIAVIHLFLNGFTDELTNFKITMNSPSTQSEILKLEELSKKISLVATAVQDPGNGIQPYSLTRAQREIMGWSDEVITQNMLEIRMEKALAAELAKTEQIIKRTGLFDKIDDMYGEPNAEYASGAGMGEEGAGGGGGGGFGGGFGDDMGGDMGDDAGGDMGEGGDESVDDGGMPPVDDGGMPPVNDDGATPNENVKMESMKKKVEKLLLENKRLIKEKTIKRQDSYLTSYLKYLNSNKSKLTEDKEDDNIPLLNSAFIKNEETNGLIRMLENKIK